MGIVDNEDVAPTLQGVARRIALEGANLFYQDELLVGWTRNEMHIGMIAVQDFTAGKTGIAWVLRCLPWVCPLPARTQQGLREAVGEQQFPDTLWAGEQIGMTHLLRSQGAAQDVDGVFVTDDVPACLLCLHADMVAEIGIDDNILHPYFVHYFTAIPYTNVLCYRCIEKCDV